MGGINRFYNPAIPQYTSQFVEDKVPFQEMMALEDYRTQRTERADETLADTNALISALMPGASTQDLSQEVQKKHMGNIQNWMEKYGKGDNIASIPAMRDLNKIRAAWQNDMDVKTILQDREATPAYTQMTMNASSRDINPNLIDGKVRQIESGEGFTPYQNLIRPEESEEYIRDVLKGVETTSGSRRRLEYVKDAEGNIIEDDKGNKLQEYVNEFYESSDDVQLGKTIDDLSEQVLSGKMQGSEYIKAKLGDDFNKEGIVDYLQDYRQEFTFAEKTRATGQLLPGQFTNKEEKEEEKDVSGTTSLPVHTGSGSDTPGNIGGGLGDPGVIDRASSIVTDIIRGERFWGALNNISDENDIMDPSKLYNYDAKDAAFWPAGVLTPRDYRRNYVWAALDKNYEDNKAAIESYIEKFDKNPDAKAYDTITWNNYKRHMTKAISSWENQNTANGKSMFSNDISEKEAYYTILNESTIDWNKSPFGDRESFKDKPLEEWTKSDKLWVRKKQKQEINDLAKTKSSDKVLLWNSASIPQGLRDLVDEAFASHTEAGVITADNASAIWRGPRIIKVGDKDHKDMSPLDRNRVFRKGVSFKINGIVDSKSTTFGPGNLSVSVDGEDYYIDMSGILGDQERLESAFYTYNQKDSQGSSDVFYIKNTRGLMDVDVADKWTKEERGIQYGDTPMMVRKNIMTDQLELLIYTEDPNSRTPSDGVSNERSETNPQGFKKVKLGKINDDPYPVSMRYKVTQEYLLDQIEKTDDSTIKAQLQEELIELEQTYDLFRTQF